ncbi:MAG: esterase [Herbinix sp.]|jgi:enterochelin esterase-like enzyme|nr:esterase [Herbinix sp.]
MLPYHNKVNKRILLCGLLVLTLLVAILYFLLLYVGNTKTKTFRSLGFEDTLTESQVIALTLESEYMDRTMPYIIYLPEGYGNGLDYPVWYGLNSYSTDEAMWINHGIDVAANELIDTGEIQPMIMVFPYTKDATLIEITKDLEDGKVDERNIDQFLTRELIPYIDSHYYTTATPEGRYIGGFSMGGMIALRTAFHHTDLFSKVGGYSPAVISSDYSEQQLEKWLFPNDIIEDIEVFDQKKGFHKLTVQLDAGNTNDPFSEGIKSLYETLQKRGIPSEFELYDGGHTLRQSSLKNYLKFYVGED